MDLFVFLSSNAATGHQRARQSAARTEQEKRRASPRPVRHLHAVRAAEPPRVAAQGEHVQKQAPSRFGARLNGSTASFSKCCQSLSLAKEL